nr:RNA-directed DNA polymerase, eukaryota [Tanacetum cinerariifolium]
MGSHRSKEDDVSKISTSIFITNFPDSFSAKELFNSCKQYGHVVDTFILTKRSKAEKRFAFVHFINVLNEERLVNNLCTIWVGRFKLHANIARVKEFASLSNLKMVLNNEGFDNFKIQYMGELWVLLEFASEDSKILFHANVGVGSWFSQLIQASMDFIIKGRIVWVEIEGDTCICGGESDVEEVMETLFEERLQNNNNLEEMSTGQKKNHSEDPFNIYELLNKKNDIAEREKNSDHSLKYPPGCYEEEENNVLKDNSSKKGSKEDVAESVCSSHFKKSVTLLTGESILTLMEELVKVGQTMGYNMKGVWLKNGNDLLIVSVYAPQELNEKKMLWDYLTYVINNWKGELIIMGDFNEVRYKSKRVRSLFNIQDKGEGNDEVVKKRMDVFKSIQDIDKLHSLEMAQKAKIKWSIEGDENSSFYHGVLNKKRSQLNIQGIMIEGTWNDSPQMVKSEFFQHFRRRFDKPDVSRAYLDMNYSKTLSTDQQVELELEGSKEDIKKAVWDCGTDKSPGSDRFTFGFYRRFWKIIENDVFEAVKHFFTHGDIPKGCNSSFIALIPKIPDANVIKDFRPISLIGSLYKIIAKILANRLVVVLGDIINEVQSAFIADRQILDDPFILNEVLQWFMENLHLSFQRVVDAGMFKGISLSPSLNLSHMFYADDAVFVGQWCDVQYTIKCLPFLQIISGLLLDAEDEIQVQIFYNVHDPLRYYRCQIPELLGKHVRGCFYGWVILSNHPRNVMWSLWNPVTSKVINLPRLIYKQSDSDDDDIDCCCLTSPSDDPNSVLLMSSVRKPHFVFCRLHPKKKKLRWTEMSYAKQLSTESFLCYKFAMRGIYIDSSYQDDDEEDVDTNYSKGDEVDADDSATDDGTLSDVGLHFLLRLQLVVAGLIHDDKRDDKEGDDDAEDMYEGLFELFQEHDDDDDEGEDIDMYEELNALFYESDYMDEVVHRFGKIHEQIIEDHWWYYFGGREVTREMLLERLRIKNIEYVENMINLAFECKRMHNILRDSVNRLGVRRSISRVTSRTPK